jgi:hypothetical protein
MIQLEYRRRFEYATRILPGLLLAGLVAGVAQFVGTQFTLPTMFIGSRIWSISSSSVEHDARATWNCIFFERIAPIFRGFIGGACEL